MIAFEAALSLLKKHRLHPDVIRHCQGVSRIAHDLARQIKNREPRLEVDPEKVRVTALLHDIGRSRKGTHERHSVRILEEEGLGEIAGIIMHGLLYERLLLEGREDKSLLPRTLEQKIVCYADLRFSQTPMTLRERIEDAVERKKANEKEVRIIRKGEKRLYRLEEELLALAGADKIEEKDEG